MTLVLICMLLTAGLELLILWTNRTVQRYITDSLSLLLAATAGLLLWRNFNLVTFGIAIVMVYRIINVERLTHRQLQADYVIHPARRASVVLLSLQILLLAVQAIMAQISIPGSSWLVALAMFDLTAAGVLAHTIDRQGRKTLAPEQIGSRAKNDLPSLTVAIPARNETADLEACLQTLVKSTYLKLEILVLDDCSQNTHTPEIIRQFAHDGVRFIAGAAPPDKWLAKNYAYEQLASEANGELILFCGVDARFEPDSLRRIVETMLDKQKTMLSVIPRNLVPSRLKVEALLVQPGRYAWELVLPRHWLDRPPVLSSCWIIQNNTLAEAGGLAAVHRAVLPERYFARYSATHNDGYSFLQSGEQLGLSSVKGFAEQRATAIRTRYPGLHRRVELTALESVLELLIFAGPFLGLIDCALTGQVWTLILFFTSAALLTYMYMQVIRITYQQKLLRGLFLLPLAVLFDVGLLNYSMWQYEFREVIWKGRNVCIPVMRVVPRLPAFDSPNVQFHGHRRRHHRRRHHRH